MPSASNSQKFDRERQIAYFSTCLQQLPAPYCKLDTNRLTMVHFCVHALDLLGVWDEMEKQNVKYSSFVEANNIIEWILSTLMHIDNNDPQEAGFIGGTFLPPHHKYHHSHIAMTYTALCILQTLGVDVRNDPRIPQTAIIRTLRRLQQPDGSFASTIQGDGEHDLRFLYCACCISYLLDDWSGIDIPRAVSYVRNCRSFDGALALVPHGGEGHGGSTFCGVASLVLMNQLYVIGEDADWKASLLHWCVTRQQKQGLQGRPNKDEDTCYSYWIGATLRLLGYDAGTGNEDDVLCFLDHAELRSFVLSCQHPVLGGFSKVRNTYPDVLHSYYSLAYLSLSQKYRQDTQMKKDLEGVSLKALNCTMGIGQASILAEEGFRPLL
ncbi:geranylgeranyl transferase type-1 subunit beta [Fistulifera solaris]|uniref:Geranylgeranyl transferase type-1 subunit beta n=1 Tax=Fistulifera solaris TaxID=1519565 RepID=A0A1Z5J8T5_FISSO|nr:geranylgeranyl transferase type-1 subunit beta [Fistulifera solaris]|eukprot:GAX10369.1 geranylgeranyl transferase type-1 subunit beta [Fistulifera solaris]